MFDLVVDQERVEFSHWQRRLVELTRFRVNVSADEPLEALSDEDWDRPTAAKHGLSIYCGFDAQRVDRDLRKKKGTSTCALLVYSCRAGRLVEQERDARHLLGLSSSGVDYTQGLTVIVEDGEGRLPLTPTKDGIAWSERTNGMIHRQNLLAWTGAVTQFFWTHHKKKFEGRAGAGGNGPKELMKKAIRSFALDNMNNVPVSENMANGQFTEFKGIKWYRIQTEFGGRWKIRRKASKYTIVQGPDTLFPMIADRIQRIKDGKMPKSKATSDVVLPNARGLRGVGGENDRCKAQTKRRCPQPDVSQNDINRVSLGALSYLRDKDKDKLFEMPVAEKHPEIKELYLEKVEKPMDFTTIESKIESYSSLTEFHNDLVLTFNNSIAFNGAESSYGKAARQMLDKLDDAFEAQDIPQVAMGVLYYLRELDEKQIFEIPVCESNPELKEAYLKVISNPMDFCTIEKRVNSYTSKAEMRQDFALIFQNCIHFNGAHSAYSRIALRMLESLDEVIENIMLGKNRRKNRINYNKLINQPRSSTGPDTPQPCPGKTRGKRIPYRSLQKKLRDAEKQIEHLKKRIMELEGKQDGKPPTKKKDAGNSFRLSTEEESKRDESDRDDENDDECYLCGDGGGE